MQQTARDFEFSRKSYARFRDGQSCDWQIDPLRIPDRSEFENFDSKPHWKVRNDPQRGRIDSGLTETHILTDKSPILV